MRTAVVGVTGMVGQVMVKVLEEFDFPVSRFIPVASERSAGTAVTYRGEKHPVITLAQAVTLKPEIAIFSAGATVSKEWAPKFAKVGTTVIDNSSAWRMDPKVKLIVPEINGDTLTSEDKIIANPNCSTIQMVLALAPLQRRYGIKRLVISTYQSVTGTGVKALRQLQREMDGNEAQNGDAAYPHPIFENVIPHCDVFLENDYTKEEMKLVHETRKIFDDDSLMITATAVRVPVTGGHSESVNVEFEHDFDIEELKELLMQTDGVSLQDDPQLNLYPMPLYAKDKNEVFVGRLRRDESQPNTLNMWIVADNLRKGAATNAVQIARMIAEKVPKDVGMNS